MDATTAGLHEVAGRGLYRGNAFRITGLPTNAGRRDVRHRQQQVMPRIVAGVAPDLGHSLPVGPDEVRSAFDRILGDPRRRLVDELFWLWEAPDTTCGCVRTLHRDHDAAVRAHCAALDRQNDPTERDRDAVRSLWSAAGRKWAAVLGRSAFWDHVRHRIAALDDRQLDESVIDVLRAEFPATLVKPLVDLAVAATTEQAWLAEQARGWPAPRRVVDDLLEVAAVPLYDAVRAASAEATSALHAGEPERAVALLQERAVPQLGRLTALVPPDQHRRTALARNDIGVVFNNCAMALIEQLGPAANATVSRWFDTALTLASDPEDVRGIEANRAGFTELVQTFETIKRRVAELVAMGRTDLAARMVRDLRRQLRGVPGTAALDAMLADLAAPVRKPRARRPAATPPQRRAPAPARPGGGSRPPRAPSRGRLSGRWKTFLVLAAVVAGVVAYQVWHDGDGPPPGNGATAALFADHAADNGPVGVCIATKDGWSADPSKVPLADCDKQHWGEVLGYPAIGNPGSPYPGDVQVQARARFQCLQLLAQQGLSTDDYTVTYYLRTLQNWDQALGPFENYTTCAVRRNDDQPLPDRPLVDPGRKPVVSVRMDLFGPKIAGDPPVGSCVATKHDRDTSIHALDIVSCEQPHWAQIVAYPVLYQHDTAWPGDDAVFAAADAACQSAANASWLTPEYRINVNYPGQDWWSNQDGELYAVCTASQPDDQTFAGGL